MDEGYWKSLLRDVEGDLEPSAANGEDPRRTEEKSGEAAGILSGESAPWDGEAEESDEADWQRAAALLTSGETITVIISGFNRGGLLADVGRVQGFLPASHLLVAPLVLSAENRMTALAGRVGESLTVKVVEIDRDRCRLILSERLVRQDGAGESILRSLHSGQICEGTVTNLCPFGVFVDLGGFEGLVHISELSWGRVESPAEVARPGDRVTVMVLQVSPGEHKISLSLKRLRPDPWQGVDDRYRAGQTLDAVITNVVNFGAFARLEPGLEGLIHISELAEGSFMHPRNVVSEGDHVRVRVLSVDGSRRRIALTMRNPDLVARARDGTVWMERPLGEID
jgi:small subunit ribosomal protein S1